LPQGVPLWLATGVVGAPPRGLLVRWRALEQCREAGPRDPGFGLHGQQGVIDQDSCRTDDGARAAQAPFASLLQDLFDRILCAQEQRSLHK
jgi:hypothetical protein